MHSQDQPAVATAARRPAANSHRAASTPGRASTSLAPGRGPITSALLTAVQRAAGNGVAVAVVQRAIQHDPANFTPEGSRAGSVEVRNLRGEPLDPGANSPTSSVNVAGWDKIKQQGFGLGGKKPDGAHYNAVRMHLWNGRLGGPGNNPLNLAPGPGQINSEMSASAETPAKNLVAANHTIWLKTKVSYQDSPANADNLASVIPNRIDMSWGVEGNAAYDDSWGSDIYLPVPPLDAVGQAKYQTWSTGAAALVLDLQAQNAQVRAQAVELVPTIDLKQAVYQAFPSLFQSLEPSAQQAFYQALGGVPAITAFAQAVTGGDDEAVVAYAVMPLFDAGLTAAAASVFATLIPTVPRQRVQLVAYKSALVGPAGPAADQIAAGDYLIFGYYDGPGRARLINGIYLAGGIDNFLMTVCVTRANIYEELDNWARRSVGDDATNRIAFINGMAIDSAIQDRYEADTNVRTASEQWHAGRTKRVKREV